MGQTERMAMEGFDCWHNMRLLSSSHLQCQQSCMPLTLLIARQMKYMVGTKWRWRT